LSKVEELEEKVQKFEDKIRLNNLFTEKRFADLELKIGQFSDKLNDITTEFPKVKDETSEIKDIVNVINLGLIDYKEKFEEIIERISDLTKLPDAVRSIRLNLENKMKDIDENFKTISANIEVMNNIKEEIHKNTEETFSSKMNELDKNIEKNRAEIAHLKSDLNGFSLALKSFERTIDSTDRKTTNIDNEDSETLKKKMNEINSTVMNTLSRMNEFEMNINKKITYIEDLIKKIKNMSLIQPVNKTGGINIPVDYQLKINELEEEVKKSKELPLEIKNAIDDLKERINGLESRITAGAETTPVGIEELKSRIEDLGKSIESINKTLYDNQREVELPKVGKEREIPKNLTDEISSLKDIVSRISSENEDSKKLMRDLRINQMQMVTSDVLIGFTQRFSTLEKKISELEKEMSKFRKEKPFVLE